MIESFVDLTYRGLSLGRRIRLSQVRPRSGYLELPAPMPVGTQIAIAADDGVTFDATVTWIHEQVGGSDRAPGMTVAPALAAEPAAAWWRARVALPDEDARPRTVTAGGRGRPVTVRPRLHTDRMPQVEGPVTDEVQAIAAELDARVAAAAGTVPGRPAADVHEAPTTVMPAIELPADAFRDGRSGGEPGATRSTGEHDVIDDGKRTMIMAPIDLVTLGLEPGATADLEATGDADGDAEADADTTDPGEPPTVPDGGAIQPSGRGRKKRRLRR